jgi:sugar (pentulose or hexulose) kinase
VTEEVMAVFDLGKTNTKLFVIAANGTIVSQTRTPPVWGSEGDKRVLDEPGLRAWMDQALREAVKTHGVTRIMFSAHGCTFALIGKEQLLHPILDYEQEPPIEIATRIDPLIPAFSETCSPRLPQGLNYGRHLLWLEELAPHTIARAEAILSYPQYWSWVFSGTAVSEVSYLGSHSHLWAPFSNDFSSLVSERGWREKMPALRRAGELVGTCELSLDGGTAVALGVHNGVHDSNASLYYYQSLGMRGFTLISSGTWVIIFNGECPVEALDERRDMLVNVTVDHRPTPTIRFMGGREYEIASGGWNKPISAQAVAAVIKAGVFALPAFAPGGPAPGQAGRFVGPPVDGEQKAAAALLYVVMMTDLSLDLIVSKNTIVVDGGLLKLDLFAGLLAALRPSQTILASDMTEGSACGAAALAFETVGIRPFNDTTRKAAPEPITGLMDYVRAWRAQIGFDASPEPWNTK